MARKTTDLRCSFCGKTRDKVGRLVAGPGVFICDGCVALCSEVLDMQPPTPPAPGQAGPWAKSTKTSRGWFHRLFHAAALQPS